MWLQNFYQKMKDLFEHLIKIPSPSGHEKAVAFFIKSFLESAGLSVAFDNTGNINDSDSGNLIAKLPGSKQVILLVAHMDTVQKQEDIVEFISQNGIYKSSGETILGADNKSGVAILLVLAKELSFHTDHPTIYFVFTTREESGQMGSSLLDIKKINPHFIINVDGHKKPGSVDIKGLGQTVFEIVVSGKASHASTAPEKGIHSIKIASQIVNSFKMGRFADGSTLNIGQINGGHATNVVPDNVVIKGETRAFTNKGMSKLMSKVSSTASTIAKKHHGKVKINILHKVGVPAWEVHNNHSLLKACQIASLETGIGFQKTSMFASSDANYLAKHGIPTINVNRGGSNPHSNTEKISLTEMETAKNFIMKSLLSI